MGCHLVIFGQTGDIVAPGGIGRLPSIWAHARVHARTQKLAFWGARPSRVLRIPRVLEGH